MPDRQVPESAEFLEMPQTVVAHLRAEKVQPLQLGHGLEVVHPSVADLSLFQREVGDLRERSNQPQVFVQDPGSVELHFHDAIPILEDTCPKGFELLDYL